MRIRAAIAAIFAVAALGLAAQQSSAADFYKGKTVTLMVPSSLGASMGLYGRIMAAAFEKYIPGHPNVIVTSRPGAGGLVGTTYAYNVAPANGTFIAMISSGNVLMPMLRDGIRYDPAKMQWLGTIAVRPSVIWLWHTAKAKTIEDAEKMQVILGSAGAGSGMSLWPKMANAVLGTKFKIIEGYKGGSEANLAAQRGETEGRWTSYSGLTAAKSQWLQKGMVRVILQFGPKIPDQKNVPSIHDMVKGENLKLVHFMELSEHVGLGLWVRPGVPKDRLAILRKAMMAATHDPAIAADAAKKRAPFDPLNGEEIHKMIVQAYTLSPSEKKRLREIVNAKGVKRGG